MWPNAARSTASGTILCAVQKLTNRERPNRNSLAGERSRRVFHANASGRRGPAGHNPTDFRSVRLPKLNSTVAAQPKEIGETYSRRVRSRSGSGALVSLRQFDHSRGDLAELCPL